MSGRGYRVVSRTNLDRTRRAHQTLLLRLSVLINVVAFLLWAWSKMHTLVAPPDRDFRQLLTQSAGNITTLNQHLQATVQILQDTKYKLSAEANSHAQKANVQEVLTDEAVDRQAEAAASISSDALSWLTIGIPTMPRHNQTDYLTPTLRHLMVELPSDPADPVFGKVRVLVMNNMPGQHAVFERVQQDVQLGLSDPHNAFAQKAAQYIEFVDNPGTVEDPSPHERPEPDDFNNPKDIPGREVRRQTCNLIELMQMAQPLSTYYMFMEDDFRMCPHTIRLLQYILAKLNALPRMLPWLGLRISYGMNGIVLKSTDLTSLANFMRARIEVKPPDLLWVEWFSGKGKQNMANKRRPMAAYRYNLLEHMGKVSSFTVRVDRPDFPKCYASMADVWSLSKAERFQARKCPNSDLSPCPDALHAEEWMRIPLAQLEPSQLPDEQ